jgi:hypothetical protein
MVHALLAMILGSSATAEEPLQYDRDIRPILSNNCFNCHGPDREARQAELRLDVRDEALEPAESGKPAIVPGKPDQSELVRRVLTDDPDERMPPPDSHKQLTSRQKDLLRRWVQAGAIYQTHWLYAPLVRPRVPKTRQVGNSNPIDAFVRSQLEAKTIASAAEADRAMLLRRLSLDLIGLPPTPAEVASWLADTSENAYEKQVDRLLDSPHFGERMAVWWLDVARFTDTVGFHGDQLQRIFPYRDYVIDAFNRNKPFDEFTVEQLAGDLLPHPTTEQLVATGFNRLNMMTREGGAQAKEYLAKYGAERVRTVGTTWLGSTLGCCECHDHKFDPFTARDFYSLQAFFADVKQYGYYADAGYSRNPELKGFGNEHPFPPEINVPSPYLQRRQAQLESQVDRLMQSRAAQLKADPKQLAAYQAWLATCREFLKTNPDGWETPTSAASDSPLVAELLPGGKPAPKKPPQKNAAKDQPPEINPLRIGNDGVVHPAAKSPAGSKLRLELRPRLRQIASLRLELVPDAPGRDAVMPKLPAQMIRVSAAIRPAKGKQRPLGFYFADADSKESRYSGMTEATGVTGGWSTSARHEQEKQTSVWLLNPPIALAKGESLVLTIDAAQTIVPMRLSLAPLAPRLSRWAPGDAGWTTFAASLPKDADQPAAVAAYFRSTGMDRALFDEYLKLGRQIIDCRHGKAWTMVTVPVAPLTIRVLPRGNWQDESGPVVEPAVPHFLPAGGLPENRRLTRLDLAQWLCSDPNPVMPRAVMNRLWKQFFGNALSSVVDDLGAQGEPPSHPELLDWLAVEFRASGWDLKHMIKLIVISHTYRQGSSLRRDLWEIDPANRLLASQNPRRLDAEFVRDNALAIAGLLDFEIGGPSVKPYQPPDYYANLQFPNRDYVADTDQRQWRRGVYMHWQRTFLHPMLANFDAPAREECTANRVCSNTPQQALTLLNDPTFVEAARVLAARILNETGLDDAARLDLAYRLALARPARAKERASLLKFLGTQREHFRSNPADAKKIVRIGLAPPSRLDPVEHAAWTQLARVILNLQETITRY